MEMEQAVPLQDISDKILAERCLTGDNKAVCWLIESNQQKLMNSLAKRGASYTEAEDILADMWADLLKPRPDGMPPLAGYSGRSSLFYWLSQIVGHKFLDLKRREKRRGEMPSDDCNPAPHIPSSSDCFFSDIFWNALEHAFKNCAADDLVMLRLVYIYNITQCDIGRIWHMHQSKVSRKLRKTADQLRESIMEYIKQKNSDLDLTWEDVLNVCERYEGGSGIN